MDPIILRSQSVDGLLLEATFLPDKGMNMISYKKGDIEVIDQSTSVLFEERYAGLGALIGPHFHHRNPEVLPVIKEESLFPHIARVRAKGVKDPFSHGIARYAPWQAQASENRVEATLTGKDLWNGVSLASLEGQNFKMKYSAELTPTGLQIEMSIVSDMDSIVGIHYYYHLPKGTGVVRSAIQNRFIEKNQCKPLHEEWKLSSQNVLEFNLDNEADYTFFPFPNALEGKILLDTGVYQLQTHYKCTSQENSWQLYHPKGASFVCIEPISSQDPRHPNLTVSSLWIQLQVL